MQMTSWPYTIGMMFVTLLLPIACYIAALVFAITRLKKHRKALQFLLIAIGIMVLTRLTWLASPLISRAVSAQTYGTIYVMLNLLATTVNLVAFGLLVAAVCADRDIKSEMLPSGQFDTSPPIESGNPYSSPK